MQVLVISLQTPQTPREHSWNKFQLNLNLKNQFAEGVIEGRTTGTNNKRLANTPNITP
jgi:hypothetical protein